MKIRSVSLFVLLFSGLLFSYAQETAEVEAPAEEVPAAEVPVEEPVLGDPRYKELAQAKYLFDVDVRMQGSLTRIGFTQDGLTAYIDEEVARIYPMLERREIDFDENGRPQRPFLSRDWGYLDVSIWTVGDEYPVAYHLEVEFGGYDAYSRTLTKSILGYSEAKSLTEENILHQTLTNLLESTKTAIFGG